MLKLRKIVSGGQAGVDRGGLLAAIGLGIDHGGWCPKGRRAEDGEIPSMYQLQETASDGYERRTERNVIDSDATIVITRGMMTPGSRRTMEICERWERTVLHVDLAAKAPRPLVRITPKPLEPDQIPLDLQVFWWLLRGEFEVVNVAGTRESKAPGIQRQTEQLLLTALRWKEREGGGGDGGDPIP